VANLEQKEQVAQNQDEKKYLAIRNWAKFQSTTDKQGKSLEGRRRTYILDFTDKESDSLYADLTIVQRYMIDACRRIRGRLGHNIPNDAMWVVRQLDIPFKERAKAAKAVSRLIEVGFLIPTGEERSTVVQPPSTGDQQPPTAANGGQQAINAREAKGINEITSPYQPIIRTISTSRANLTGIESSPVSSSSIDETETDQNIGATPSGTSSPNPNRDATQTSRTQAAPSGKATPSTMSGAAVTASDRDIELINIAIPSPQWDALNDEDSMAVQLCHEVSKCSGVSVKPSWVAPAREVVTNYGWTLACQIIRWIFVDQKAIPRLKFYWADCTKSTKNLRDHMDRGAILGQYQDWRAAQEKIAAARKKHHWMETTRAGFTPCERCGMCKEDTDYDPDCEAVQARNMSTASKAFEIEE
jgi:hypothetical protein